MQFRRLAAATLLWVSVAASAAFADSLGDYQWGATAATIVRQTGAEPGSGEAGTLVKREVILGRVAYVTYQFVGNGLSAVGIQWDEKIFSSVKDTLDRDYGASSCMMDEKNCSWTSSHSRIRLVENPSLGVTLLVFSKRS